MDKRQRFSLLRAIADNYGRDSTPHRLVYADWCEENGLPDMADRVRRHVDRNHACTGGIPGVPGSASRGETCHYNRGLITVASMNQHNWFKHGPALVQEWPIRSVWLTDVRPLTLPDGRHFWLSHPVAKQQSRVQNHLWHGFFVHLQGYTACTQIVSPADRAPYLTRTWPDAVRPGDFAQVEYPGHYEAEFAASKACLEWAFCAAGMIEGR